MNDLNNPPKPIKAKLRQLAETARETELGNALEVLAHSFDQWREKRLSNDDLSDRINAFYRGEARSIFKRYSDPNIGNLRLTVGSALYHGILDESTFPQELRPYVEAILEILALADRDKNKPRATKK